MNEPPEDLKVVCTRCHAIEDRRRDQKTEIRNNEILLDAQFTGWARKVYGDNWMIGRDENIIYDEFVDWLDRLDY